MPAATYQIPGGARVFIFTCEGCGEPACFGFHVKLHASIAKKDVALAGQWWCARRQDGSGYCAKASATAPLDLVDAQ